MFMFMFMFLFNEYEHGHDNGHGHMHGQRYGNRYGHKHRHVRGNVQGQRHWGWTWTLCMDTDIPMGKILPEESEGILDVTLCFGGFLDMVHIYFCAWSNYLHQVLWNRVILLAIIHCLE